MPSINEKIAGLKADRKKHLDKAQVIREMADEREDGLTEAETAKITEHVEAAEQVGEQIASLEAQAGAIDRLDRASGDLDRVDRSRTRQGGRTAEDLEAERATGAVIEHVQPRWMEDPNKGFRSATDFFASVIQTDPGTQLTGALAYLATDKEGTPLHMAAGSDEQSTFADPYGGFLVPAGLAGGDILSVQAEGDPIAGRVMRIPMDRPTVSVNARVDKNHANSVSGGLRFYRRAEADQAQSSRMEFDQVKMEATSLQGIAYATEELLMDSPRSFAAILAAGFQTELASKLLEERLNGTGAGQFEGINNSPALITVAKEDGQAADTIVYKNLVKMLARSWMSQNAVWMYNHTALPQLMTLKDDNNQLIWQSSARDGEPDRILGRPAFASEYMNAVGDAGDINLVNWGEYLEGVYQPLQSAESIHVRFLQHERAFKFFTRNAGKGWWRSALTPRNGETLSPIVRLGARA